MLDATEYYYLKNMKYADSAEIINLQYQKLILNEILVVKLISVKHSRRIFNQCTLELGPKFDGIFNLQKADRVLIEPLLSKNQMKLADIKKHLLKHLRKDLDNYTRWYIVPRLKEKGLIKSYFYKGSEGRASLKKMDQNIYKANLHYYRLKINKADIDTLINRYGTCILFIKKAQDALAIKFPYINALHLDKYLD